MAAYFTGLLQAFQQKVSGYYFYEPKPPRLGHASVFHRNPRSATIYQSTDGKQMLLISQQ
jgi:hypothetical protein